MSLLRMFLFIPHAARLRWSLPLAPGVVLLTCLTIAACGTSPPAAQGPPAATETTPSADAAFPVTIEHRYGSTTIPDEPQRVVTVGLTDHDAALALGVTPVATTEWVVPRPGNIFPWAEDALAELRHI